MKKNLFLLIAAMLVMPAMFAQTKNVARECVLFELMTGVYCGNCPGAEEGIAEMLADGMAIAPLCYQDDYFSEPTLYTDEIQRRVDYYPHSGCPTLIVDGINNLPGGGSNTYYYYEPYYQSRIGVASPFTIAMSLDAIGGGFTASTAMWSKWVNATVRMCGCSSPSRKTIWPIRGKV